MGKNTKEHANPTSRRHARSVFETLQPGEGLGRACLRTLRTLTPLFCVSGALIAQEKGPCTGPGTCCEGPARSSRANVGFGARQICAETGLAAPRGPMQVT